LRRRFERARSVSHAQSRNPWPLVTLQRADY
jgi:hypothetical protein